MGPLGVGSGVDPDEGRMYSLVGNPMGISGIWGFSLKRLPSAEQRKGFVTAYLDQLTDFDLVNYLQVIDFGRVVGMPFANGYLTSE